MNIRFQLRQGDQIRDIDTDEIYQVDRYISSGVYGVIYDAIPLSSQESQIRNNHKVVIKYGRIDEDSQADENSLIERIDTLNHVFELERKTIKKLSKYSKDRYVPWTRIGEFVDQTSDRNPPILIMQMIDDRFLLTKMFQHDGSIDDEKLAIETGIQYIEMLSILHDQMRITCGDRKLNDIRLKDEALYVLDWNVIHELNKLESGDQDNLKMIQSDFQVFGNLWFQMLMGYGPGALDKLVIDDQPGSTSSWHKITRPLRKILVKSLKSSTGYGYKNSEEIQSDLQSLSENYKKSKSELYDDFNEIRNTDSEINIQMDQIADILSIFNRSYPDSHHTTEIRTWYTANKKFSSDEFQSKFSAIVKSLKSGEEYNVGGLDNLRKDHQFQNSQKLQASRWFHAASFLRLWGETLGSDVLKDLRKELIRFLEESNNWGITKSHANLDQFSEIWKDSVNQVLNKKGMGDLDVSPDEYPNEMGYHIEVVIADYKIWDDVYLEQRSKDQEEKLRFFERIEDHLLQIKSIDPLHANLIQSEVGYPLSGVIAEMREEVSIKEAKQKVEKTAEEAVIDVDAALDKAIDRDDVIWPQELNISIQRIPMDSRLGNLAFLNRSIQDRQGYLSSNNLQNANQICNELRSDYPVTARNLRLVCSKLALARIEMINTQRSTQIEFQEGLTIAEELRKKDWDLGEEQMKKLEHENEQLTLKNKTASDLNEKIRGMENPSDNMEDTQLDRALKDAIHQNVEILDTWDESKDVSMTERFLAIRELERYKKNLEEIDTSINKKYSSLVENSENIGALLEKLKDMQTMDTLQELVQNKKRIEELEGWLIILDDQKMEELNQRYELLKSRLMVINTEWSQIEELKSGVASALGRSEDIEMLSPYGDQSVWASLLFNGDIERLDHEWKTYKESSHTIRDFEILSKWGRFLYHARRLRDINNEVAEITKNFESNLVNSWSAVRSYWSIIENTPIEVLATKEGSNSINYLADFRDGFQKLVRNPTGKQGKLLNRGEPKVQWDEMVTVVSEWIEELNKRREIGSKILKLLGVEINETPEFITAGGE